MEITIGSHMSIAKGLAKAALDTAAMGGTTMQIFSRNPRGSHFKESSTEEIEKFHSLCREHHIEKVLAHAPYTMNLASDKEEVYSFGCQVILEDIKRMENLGASYLVFHPGSHTGIGVKKGIENIVKALDQGMTGNESMWVLLETMSGKGTEIGVTFEELALIKEQVKYPEKIGICLDTCHVFAAGYDIVHDLDGVLQKFDEVIGLDWLKAIHLNDSMMPFGSHKDRHAPIGEGEIGMEAFVQILTHPSLEGLPFYLETPFDNAGHQKEIEKLKKMLAKY